MFLFNKNFLDLSFNFVLRRVLLAQIDSLEHAPSVDFHTPPLPLDFPEKASDQCHEIHVVYM